MSAVSPFLVGSVYTTHMCTHNTHTHTHMCVHFPGLQPGRRLEICRTFSQNGVEYQRKETVKNPAVIEAYLKFARNKDKDQFRSVGVGVSYTAVGVSYTAVGVSYTAVGVSYTAVGVSYTAVGVSYTAVGVSFIAVGMSCTAVGVSYTAVGVSYTAVGVSYTAVGVSTG